MKTGTNKTGAEEDTSILQVQRPLLPIEKYAAREGLTRAIVEEYGRLGIVQLRKYKGKTYVVDVPPSPYQPACEQEPILQENHRIAAQAPLKSVGTEQAANKTQAKKTSEDSRKVGSDSHRAGSDSRKAGSQSTFSGQKAAPDTHKIMGKPAKSNIESARGGVTLTKSMFCKASKIKRQLMGKIEHETTGDFQLENRKFSGPAKQAPSKRPWQVATVSLIACLCMAFLSSLWLYMNQRVHRSRLDEASASIHNVYQDSVRISQQLATFQNKLVESTAELGLVKNELNNTKAETENAQAEIKSLRHEITKVKQSLEAVQQHNIAALEQLREQLQQLTTQLSEFVPNNPPAAELRRIGQPPSHAKKEIIE